MGTPSTDPAAAGADPTPPDVSVVVPCFNCADIVGASITALTAHLERMGGTWEVILVDDGSSDGTGDVLEARADGVRVHALRMPRNRGKGRAVSLGMVRATGTCRVFTDADLPYALDAIGRCAHGVQAGHAAVFGNRLLADSDATVQPWVRKGLGRAVQAAVGLLLGRSDVDTQCGLKAFAGPVADVVFRDLRTDGFLFDVEVALLLTRAGLDLDFIPVVLVNHDKSSIRFVPTGLRTLAEGWRILRTRREDARKIESLRSLYLRSNT